VNVNTSPDNGDWTYAYDAANRLSSATDPAGVATTYGYDGAGNRNFVQVGQGPAVTTTYDQAGLPVSASDGTTYTHDQVGNLTGVNASGTADDWTYAYDPWNRMTRATGAAGAIDYAYDGLDRTVSRTEGASTTTYAYSGATHDPAREVTGGTTTLYAFSPDGPLAQKQGTTTRFYMTDPHDDVVGVASTAGSLVGTRSFSPWGEPRTTTGEQTLFGSQSDPTDPDTGLVDMTSRYYDPGMGRFTTRDVLFGDPTMPVSLNQYVYGADSPLSYADPTGMAFESGGGSGSPPTPMQDDLDFINAGGVAFGGEFFDQPGVQQPTVDEPKLPLCKRKPWLCRKPDHKWKNWKPKPNHARRIPPGLAARLLNGDPGTITAFVLSGLSLLLQAGSTVAREAKRLGLGRWAPGLSAGSTVLTAAAACANQLAHGRGSVSCAEHGTVAAVSWVAGCKAGQAVVPPGPLSGAFKGVGCLLGGLLASGVADRLLAQSEPALRWNPGGPGKCSFASKLFPFFNPSGLEAGPGGIPRRC
jgi:RHS repeat-associated protein